MQKKKEKKKKKKETYCWGFAIVQVQWVEECIGLVGGFSLTLFDWEILNPNPSNV